MGRRLARRKAKPRKQERQWHRATKPRHPWGYISPRPVLWSRYLAQQRAGALRLSVRRHFCIAGAPLGLLGGTFD